MAQVLLPSPTPRKPNEPFVVRELIPWTLAVSSTRSGCPGLQQRSHALHDACVPELIVFLLEGSLLKDACSRAKYSLLAEASQRIME